MSVKDDVEIKLKKHNGGRWEIGRIKTKKVYTDTQSIKIKRKRERDCVRKN